MNPHPLSGIPGRKMAAVSPTAASTASTRRTSTGDALVSFALVAILGLLWPTSAFAQSGQVVEYYHLDALGSVRVVTDQAGQVLTRHDFLPFGEEWNPPSSSKEKKLFTGHERNAETGLDYFGARYYRPNFGRFTTVDPVGLNPLRLVNPQRFNRYSYANNNPLTFIDPDGRDAIVLNFSQGAMVGGIALGHAGVAVVASNGVVTFSEFIQLGDGLIGTPQVNTTNLVVHLQFDSNGNPTPQSLSAVAQEAGNLAGAVPGSVQLAYFKTSTAETAALTAWIEQSKAEWQNGLWARYAAVGRNCGNYVREGMSNLERFRLLGGTGLSFPNLDFLLFMRFADAFFRQMKPDVTTEITGFRLPDAQGR